MLVCPKCNYDNELGRIFCHSCGAKLDLTQIKPPSQAEKKRRRVQRGALRWIRIGVELVVTLTILAMLGLICLTPELQPFQGDSKDLLTADAKHTALEKLVAGRKGGQVTVSEGELNVFLTSLSFDRPTGSGIEVVPSALRATLLVDGALLIEFLGEIHFGTSFTKRLYLAYNCTPTIRDGKCVFLPNGARIGTLPIHPTLLVKTPFVENYFGQLFSQLGEDKKRLLDPLAKITITKDSITFEKEPLR